MVETKISHGSHPSSTDPDSLLGGQGPSNRLNVRRSGGRLRSLTPLFGLLFIVSLVSACGTGERAVEIAALRKMVAETQLLVAEYRVQL
ncbi:uncharacterized protein METZ01_LOCUS390311, partial [marine metagenome]